MNLRTLRIVGIALFVLLAVAIFAAVGGPAAVASYRHAQDVAQHYGETEAMSDWLPLTTDGMLVAALIVMYSRRWRKQRVGFGPWFAFVLGGLATGGANLASAIGLDRKPGEPDWTLGDIAVALWPPVAFGLTLELIAMMVPIIRAMIENLDAPPPPPARATRRVTAPTEPAAPPAAPEPSTAPRQAAPRRTRKTPRVDLVKRPRGPVQLGPSGKTDEEILAELQALADESGAVPLPGAVRRLYGCGTDRANRLHSMVRQPVGAAAP